MAVSASPFGSNPSSPFGQSNTSNQGSGSGDSGGYSAVSYSPFTAAYDQSSSSGPAYPGTAPPPTYGTSAPPYGMPGMGTVPGYPAGIMNQPPPNIYGGWSPANPYGGPNPQQPPTYPGTAPLPYYPYPSQPSPYPAQPDSGYAPTYPGGWGWGGPASPGFGPPSSGADTGFGAQQGSYESGLTSNAPKPYGPGAQQVPQPPVMNRGPATVAPVPIAQAPGQEWWRALGATSDPWAPPAPTAPLNPLGAGAQQNSPPSGAPPLSTGAPPWATYLNSGQSMPGAMGQPSLPFASAQQWNTFLPQEQQAILQTAQSVGIDPQAYQQQMAYLNPEWGYSPQSQYQSY